MWTDDGHVRGQMMQIMDMWTDVHGHVHGQMMDMCVVR